MTEISQPPQVEEKPEELKQSFLRFELNQRIEHILLLTSFSLLGITGLPQKFPLSPVSQVIIDFFGGIELTRLIHHISAVVLLAVSIFHVLAVLYRIIVLRVDLSMIPILKDFIHLFQDIGYFVGLRKHRAFYDRYNYAEKAEYFAVVWGTLIMAITGFMMWNPIATTKFLPGQSIPAAKAAHGGEAVLAVLAIIIWHFYHVHMKIFNKSMFNGHLTRKQMAHEHPAELERIEMGKSRVRPDHQVIHKRQQVFFPIAAVVAVIGGFGLYKFVTIEDTAIKTIPPAEQAAIYVPVTPTPRPTPAPTPTPQAGVIAAAPPNTWDGSFQVLFDNRCGKCHGRTAVSGLTLANYRDALKGGKSGPAIVPGDPDRSMLVQMQSKGNHPGQLTQDELNQVIAWIKAGAPEK